MFKTPRHLMVQVLAPEERLAMVWGPEYLMTFVRGPREVVSRREPSCLDRLYSVLCSTAEDINDRMVEGAPWSLWSWCPIPATGYSIPL